jgi:hypothetical protein
MKWWKYVVFLLAGLFLFALAVLFFLGLEVLCTSLQANGWI